MPLKCAKCSKENAGEYFTLYEESGKSLVCEHCYNNQVPAKKILEMPGETFAPCGKKEGSRFGMITICMSGQLCRHCEEIDRLEKDNKRLNSLLFSYEIRYDIKTEEIQDIDDFLELDEYDEGSDDDELINLENEMDKL